MSRRLGSSCPLSALLFATMITTAAATTVTGSITTTTGVGIAGVTLSFSGGGPVATTAANGTFSVVVTAGTYDIDIVGPASPLYAPKQLLAVVITGTTQSLGTMTLPVGFTLSGTIVTQGGALVVGGDTDVFDAATGEKLFTPGDNTNASGVFSVVVPSGTFIVECDPVVGTTFVAQRIANVVVNGATNVGTVTLPPGVTLSGTVRNAQTLLGINLVDIDVDDQATGIRVATPDDDTTATGAFSVVVNPNRVYTVSFDPPPGLAVQGRRIFNVFVGAAATAMGNIDLQNGFLVSGTVVNANSQPVGLTDIDALHILGPSEVYIANDRSAANGTFTTCVTAGTYFFLIIPPSSTTSAPRRIGPVTVSGTTNLGTIVLPLGHVLSGNVQAFTLNSEGDADIDVINPSTGEILVTPSDNTDGFGNYSVRIPAGTWNVLVTPRKGSLSREKLIQGVAVNGPSTLNTTLTRVPMFIYLLPASGAVPLIVPQGGPLTINAALWNTNAFLPVTAIVRLALIDPAGNSTNLFPVVPLTLSPNDFLLGLTVPLTLPPVNPAHLGFPFTLVLRSSDPVTGETYDSDLFTFIVQ